MSLTRRTLLGALGAIPLTRIARGQVAHRLTIVHLNDFHSRHDPVDGRLQTCRAGGAECYGGSPRLATAIAAVKAAAVADGRDPILLDAGDQFQGSLFFTAHGGATELAVMHQVGTEAMAVGNHEFDRGPATLATFIKGARFPVLSCNIDASADPDLAGLIKPWATFTRAGLPIAVVGVTVEETSFLSSPGPNVHFNDAGRSVAASAAAARAAGARLIIVLSHLGVERDRELAGTVPGAPVWIGGHSHTLLSNSEAGAILPHPVVQNGPAGAALIVQAACFGRYLGRLDLDLGEDGAVLAWGGDTHHVGLDTPEDPEVARIVAAYAAPLEALRSRVVASLSAAVSNEQCRVGECAIGNMIADAMLAGGHNAQVALMNGGGIRTGLHAGEVTYGDVLGVMPFGNTLATLELTGADLKASLEHGISRIGQGGFAQVAGVREVYDTSRPDGDRLVEVSVRGPDGQWRPLDLARSYRVVTNDFMRHGGDGYDLLRDRARDAYDSGPILADVFLDALAASPAPATDGRLTKR